MLNAVILKVLSHKCEFSRSMNNMLKRDYGSHRAIHTSDIHMQTIFFFGEDDILFFSEDILRTHCLCGTVDPSKDL